MLLFGSLDFYRCSVHSPNGSSHEGMFIPVGNCSMQVKTHIHGKKSTKQFMVAKVSNKGMPSTATPL